MTHDKYLRALVREARFALKQIGAAQTTVDIIRAHKKYTTILEMISVPAKLAQDLDPQGAETYREVAAAAIEKMETEEILAEGADL